MEKLQLMVTEYVSDLDTKESFQTFLKSREGKEIDQALQIPDPKESGGRVNAVQMGEYYYVILEENGNYKIEKLNTDLGNIEGGITLATPENFDKGKNGTMEFNPGEGGKSTLVFSDVIDDEFCFDIKSGEVTIYIDNDMTLTNEHVKPARSAINIEPGATLNLYVAEGKTLTVNSGFGTQGATGHMGEMKQNEGGDGAFAGIRVPSTEDGVATLNLYGSGTVVAFGGDATAGGAGTSYTTGMSSRGNGGGRWRAEQELGIGRKSAEKVVNRIVHVTLLKVILHQIIDILRPDLMDVLEKTVGI